MSPRGDRFVQQAGRQRRHVGLATLIVAPSHHFAIAAQGETELVPAGDRLVPQPLRQGWNVQLAVEVGAPSKHGAIAAQGHAVLVPPGDGRVPPARWQRRHVALTEVVPAPTHSRPWRDRLRAAERPQRNQGQAEEAGHTRATTHGAPKRLRDNGSNHCNIL